MKKENGEARKEEINIEVTKIWSRCVTLGCNRVFSGRKKRRDGKWCTIIWVLLSCDKTTEGKLLQKKNVV